ncbi:MAG: glucohydrolase, partial [Fulvivirga sp.]|nr:glucohydrolase [Fulvivirga sp.]
IETLNSWKEAYEAGLDMNEFMDKVHMQSRDNARTPMQWDTSRNSGFTSGDPWIKINPNYEQINVAKAETDPKSILNYYREMISFRKEHQVMVYGDYESIDNDNPVIYAYRRWDENADFLIVHNFGDNSVKWMYPEVNKKFRDYEVIKSNISANNGAFEFAPWQSKIYKL